MISFLALIGSALSIQLAPENVIQGTSPTIHLTIPDPCGSYAHQVHVQPDPDFLVNGGTIKPYHVSGWKVNQTSTNLITYTSETRRKHDLHAGFRATVPMDQNDEIDFKIDAICEDGKEIPLAGPASSVKLRLQVISRAELYREYDWFGKIIHQLERAGHHVVKGAKGAANYVGDKVNSWIE